MELHNNGIASEVMLTDDEQALLGVAENSLAATAIGTVWRAALEVNDCQLQACESAITPPTVLLTPLGAITCQSAAYREAHDLRRRHERLLGMAHQALAIELETLGPQGEAL
jgi:hypothetical protein